MKANSCWSPTTRRLSNSGAKEEQEDALRWVKSTRLTRPVLTKSSIFKNKYGTREEFQKQHGLDTIFRGANMRAGTVISEKMVEEELKAMGSGADS